LSTIDTILVILKNKNLKQKDLTDYLGITKNAFTDWKSGRIESWKKYLPQIAEFLGVTVDELLGAPVPMPDPQMQRLLSLIRQLDEADRLRLEGMAAMLLTDPKYNKKSAPQDA